jgi:hypothetical protein
VTPNHMENTHFSTERVMKTINQVQVFLRIRELLSAVKRVQFVSDWMSYIIIRAGVISLF